MPRGDLEATGNFHAYTELDWLNNPIKQNNVC